MPPPGGPAPPDVESGRLRVCGGLLVSVNRSWQVPVGNGPPAPAPMKSVAPLALADASDRGAGGTVVLVAVAGHDAYWLGFETDDEATYAVVVHVDGRNPLTGRRGPGTPDDGSAGHLVVPDQPWLDMAAGPGGGLSQLVPHYGDAGDRPDPGSGGEVEVVVHRLRPDDLESESHELPDQPVPQYDAGPDQPAGAPEPGGPGTQVHPWSARRLRARRAGGAPEGAPCARFVLRLLQPGDFEQATGTRLPEGLFDDTGATPPPPERRPYGPP